jgi:hypothetical protein
MVMIMIHGIPDILGSMSFFYFIRLTQTDQPLPLLPVGASNSLKFFYQIISPTLSGGPFLHKQCYAAKNSSGQPKGRTNRRGKISSLFLLEVEKM